MYGAGFLFTLSLGLIYYITSTFLSTFMSEGRVGLLYTVASLTSLVGLLVAPVLLRKLGAYVFLLLSAFCATILLFALAFAKTAAFASVIFILSFPFNTIVLFALDEFIKIFSEEGKTGSTRGLYLTICHVALIGTQLAFWLGLGSFSFKTIFILSASMVSLFLLTTAINLRNIPEPHYDHGNILKFVGKYFRKGALVRAYGLNFLLQLFYAWMIIYTPIYLSQHLGFSWQEIGFILALMLLPFLVIPYSLGSYGDKFGERRMLMAGFAIAALTTLLLFFVTVREVWVWALLLFLTRIGAASVEIMADTYFFKHIRAENEEFIGVYRTSTPVAFVLGPLLASLIFPLLPTFHFLYVILAAFMLWGVYIASTIRKNDI
jgi:predicted MFS family arabinose efflux permease